MSMSHTPLKAAIKRGALIAAANWPVTVIQASADSLFKLLLTTPVVGGVFVIALAVGSEPSSLITPDWRQTAATIASAIREHPGVLAAFLLAMMVVSVGGSFFVFLVKAGTVATLVRSEREAGPVEDAPLGLGVVTRASRFSIDAYVEAARAYFPRYARLGIILMGVYLVSGVSFLVLVARREAGGGWSLTALLSAAFIVWITGVNLLYLLVQIVMTADDCGVAAASRRVSAFLRQDGRQVGSVFALLLVLIVGATIASVLATAALGLVAFIPFLGLAALPLQLLAWLMRGLVFQYLGLTSVGAYLKLYRAFAARARGSEVKPAAILDRLPSQA
jgi:hypothetical protein